MLEIGSLLGIYVELVAYLVQNGTRLTCVRSVGVDWLRAGCDRRSVVPYPPRCACAPPWAPPWAPLCWPGPPKVAKDDVEATGAGGIGTGHLGTNVSLSSSNGTPDDLKQTLRIFLPFS